MSHVYVGLSGGVDSAVSAALLKSEGHTVTGVFIKIWQPEFIECSWREDRLDAMRVCAKLGIPYKEIDLSDEYKKDVVENMVASYARGVTPNPDVLCNHAIKFGSFMQWALDDGAEVIATGHYARSEEGRLLRGQDVAKDQSYFLHYLTADQLWKIAFPVGSLEKREVRALAKRFALPVAAKPDSQGLCFVGDITLPEFLSHYIALASGDVLDGRGKIIGTHDGAMRYTIGQRHGFSIKLEEAESAPHYVIATDPEANTITVSADMSAASRAAVVVENMHWIDEAPALPREFDVQTRYREQTVRATVREEGSGVHIEFTNPHLVSPGQSLVVYDGDECLGGGEIA